MFDSKCYELAEHFLADHPAATEAQKNALAQEIQSCIETWLGYDPQSPECKPEFSLSETAARLPLPSRE